MLLIFLPNLGMGGSDSTVPIITPDCFVGFIGTLVDPAMEPCGFVGAISENNGFNGSIDASSAGFVGAMSDENGYIGDLCDD
jgi:hypothetical protein